MAADGVLIQLVVQGNRNGAVRVVNIQPVVSCHAPLVGTLFYSPSAGADLDTQLQLNLDEPLAPSHYISAVNGQVTGGTNFFGHFTVSLKRGEQFTFLIDAFTGTQYWRFTLDMTALDGDHTETESVSDGGKPFQVSAIYDEDSVSPGAFSRYKELYVEEWPGPGAVIISSVIRCGSRRIRLLIHNKLQRRDGSGASCVAAVTSDATSPLQRRLTEGRLHDQRG